MRRSQSRPDAYFQGKAARNYGKSKLTVPYDNMATDWAWWLAGWNDCDMALGKSIESAEV